MNNTDIVTTYKQCSGVIGKLLNRLNNSSGIDNANQEKDRKPLPMIHKPRPRTNRKKALISRYSEYS
jgi:hypothetical protein